MTRKEKQDLRQHQSTRQLMGIGQLTDHGVKTANGELVIFIVQPDNLSVLSSEGVRSRVQSLTDLLRTTQEVRILALDSRESFQRNKDCYRQRIEDEKIPALRELLRQDMEHLDAIQSGTASSREFALVCTVEDTDQTQLSQMERRIHGHGFRVRLAGEQDVKRIPAVYYQQDVVTDHFPNFEGEQEGKNRGEEIQEES